MKHQGNDTASPSDDPILPEVYTATVACIYDVDGKCKGILTPERLIILLRAFKKANATAYMTTFTWPPVLH
jgi:hypothetical protein